jgi:hypothetical protein
MTEALTPSGKVSKLTTDVSVWNEGEKKDPIHVQRAVAAKKRVPPKILELPEDHSGHDRNLLPSVREGMRVLKPQGQDFEGEVEKFKKARVKYAPMHAHMELAATALAAGASFRLAATHAGLSVRQVKKYYSDPDFRSRIEELRNTMFSKIRGRVIKEMEKRTDPGKIEKIELLDLLRVFDRVAGPIGGKAGVNIAGDVNVGTSNYDTIIQAVLAQNTPSEEPDFPSFELNSSTIPIEDTP